MKKISLFILSLIICLSACFSFGCGAAPSGGMTAGDKHAPAPDIGKPSGGIGETAAPDTIPGDPTAGEDSGKDSSPGNEQNVTLPAGQLTAGAQNDNDYYSDWLKLFFNGQNSADSGKFADKIGYFDLYSLDRVKVTVKSGDKPVEQAYVSCISDDQKVLFNAMTDANGVAYLFPNSESGKIVVELTDSNIAVKKTVDFSADNRDLTVDIEKEAPAKNNLIQLMFVVDATGSMGDEMRYLTAELGDVIKRIVKNNGVKIDLGFLFYRDDCDKEKFFDVPFKDVTEEVNYREMQNILAKQRAEGGGDYPEALDEALLKAVNRNWAANATKIIFNVLDAPCHEESENIKNYSSAVNAAAAKGIRICPVMASGANMLTEYLVRQAAILTGGTFTFITDDSGIGGSHYDPDLPNVVVERLNDMLVRLVEGYYTGTFAKPVYWKDAIRNELNGNG